MSMTPTYSLKQFRHNDSQADLKKENVGRILGHRKQCSGTEHRKKCKTPTETMMFENKTQAQTSYVETEQPWTAIRHEMQMKAYRVAPKSCTFINTPYCWNRSR